MLQDGKIADEEILAGTLAEDGRGAGPIRVEVMTLLGLAASIGNVATLHALLTTGSPL